MNTCPICGEFHRSDTPCRSNLPAPGSVIVPDNKVTAQPGAGIQPSVQPAIRVVKCSVGHGWYNQHIGQTFQPFAKDGYGYWVRTGDTFNTCHWIKPEDVEILPAPDPTKASPPSNREAEAGPVSDEGQLGAGIHSTTDAAGPQSQSEPWHTLVMRVLAGNVSMEPEVFFRVNLKMRVLFNEKSPGDDQELARLAASRPLATEADTKRARDFLGDGDAQEVESLAIDFRDHRHAAVESAVEHEKRRHSITLGLYGLAAEEAADLRAQLAAKTAEVETLKAQLVKGAQ